MSERERDAVERLTKRAWNEDEPDRTTEPTTAEERQHRLDAIDLASTIPPEATMTITEDWAWERRLITHVDTLAATNRALTEALRIRVQVWHDNHAGRRGYAELETCPDAFCVTGRALFSGQLVQARDTEYGALEAMAADVRSLSTQLGQKIEQAVERDGELERLREALDTWLPVIEEAKRQDERWQKPMSELPSEKAVFVWALKAQEELGELSAALLGRLIEKDGRGDPLTECYQTIAVLMRVARALLPEARDA
jgi:hypothetical protein